jgi:hypothetical protein
MSRWLRQLSLVTWAAVVLAGVAIVAVVVAIASDRFDNWTPNIATEALAIAVTIGVVERIVRRENERLVRPRVGRAMQVLAFAIKRFVQGCIFDYFARHPGPVRPPAYWLGASRLPGRR